MSPRISETLGLQVGPFVPLPEFDHVLRFSGTWGRQGSAWAQLFSNAWMGLAYRARTCGEHAPLFAATFSHGQGGTEQRYWQDHHLFGFVASACAATENLIFAIYAVAQFLVDASASAEILGAHRGELLRRARSQPNCAAAAQRLQDAIADDTGRHLFELRDVLVHRGRLRLHHQVSLGRGGTAQITMAANPKEIPDNWIDTVVMNASLLHPFERWLTRALRESIGMLANGLAEPASEGLWFRAPL